MLSVSVPECSSYLFVFLQYLGIRLQEFFLNEACINIFRTHRLVKPARNRWYLFEAGIVPINIIFDLLSVFFHIHSSLGILA